MEIPDYECENCIGMPEYGCYCRAHNAIAPGGPLWNGPGVAPMSPPSPAVLAARAESIRKKDSNS